MKKENLGLLRIRVIPENDIIERLKSIPYCPIGDISFNKGTLDFGFIVRVNIAGEDHLFRPNFIHPRVHLGEKVLVHFVGEYTPRELTLTKKIDEITNKLIAESGVFYQNDIYQPKP